MKKVSFGLLFIFFINIVTVTGLTQEQLWAIALTGVMSERNRSRHNTLNSTMRNTSNKNIWLEVLRRDWGINNKEELLKALDLTEKDGHASSLSLVQSIIREGIISVTAGDEENILITTKLNKHLLNYRHYRYLYFTYSNWENFSGRTILAWDLGRNIALCRWGYDVVFFTENEAWEKIMYYAKLIQPLYSSWEEYGYDYYMGRVFWASGFGEAEKYDEETRPIYEKLTSRSGLWYNLRWNIDLK